MSRAKQCWQQFRQALYAFYKGYSIPLLIWSQIHKFWDGIHARGKCTTNKWRLPFPFLLIKILHKKSVKGTSTDGPVKVHPKFGRIQWTQSQSHMPKGLKAPAPDAERVEEDPMDMNAPAATQGMEEKLVLAI